MKRLPHGGHSISSGIQYGEDLFAATNSVICELGPLNHLPFPTMAPLDAMFSPVKAEAEPRAEEGEGDPLDDLFDEWVAH
jgi:hypothetical protein